MNRLGALRWVSLLGALILLVDAVSSSSPQVGAVPLSLNGAAAAPIAGDPFGIDFISAVNGQIPTYGSARYQQASSAGATWNRWVFYWQDIEQNAGSPDYAPQDTVVNQDVAHGLGYKIDAVLMGTPAWAADGGAATFPQAASTAPAPRVGQHRYPKDVSIIGTSCPSTATYPPQNLNRWIFSDNSDQPGPGKTINQANYWARFVYNTVARYKDRIRHWEIWNEPDYLPNADSNWYGFWCGSATSYYRLLKVAYLAAKTADPSAVILMGGMAYWPEIVQLGKAPFTFFKSVLSSIVADGQAAASGYFFDVSPWHWYSRSNQSYYKVRDTQAVLASYGLGGKAIWLNESGIPAWDDPPGPGHPFPYSANLTEQASYVMQALAYGLAAGVERQLVFQEYDDGNGEAYGLVRNSGNPRPAYYAYKMAASYLTGTYTASLTSQGNASLVTAYTNAGNRVVAIWNNAPSAMQASVPAQAASAQLLGQPTAANLYGSQQTIYPSNGQYWVNLPGATDNNSDGESDYIVGGLVSLIVENAQAPPPPSILPTGLVANGGFERQPAFTGWYLSGYIPASLSGTAKSGIYSAKLAPYYVAQPGLVPPGANSTLTQTVTLPVSADLLQLQFSYLMSISDSGYGGTCSGDKFEVLLFDHGIVRYDLLTDCVAKPYWTDVSIDLSPYLGHQVVIAFNVWQSDQTANHPTSAYVDDVRIWPYREYLGTAQKQH